MIKKTIVCLLLALVFAVLGQRQIFGMLSGAVLEAIPFERKAETAAPLPSFSEQMGTQAVSDTLGVTLYYRYEDTGLLSAREAQLDIRREETIATSIVQRLISGPSAASRRLQGLFPRGTRLISVSTEGATAFVTLSRDFLGKPDGAPADWEDLSYWQEEAARRRLLAVQSIVLSLTEDGRAQRVQVYVADVDDDVPERIPLAYFSPEAAPGVMLGACSRDESFLLTPRRVLMLMLESWQRRDYAALHAMLSSGREALPTQEAFQARMRELDVSLLSFDVTAGSVSYDGLRATLVLDALTRTPDGGDTTIQREAVPLHREGENWTMTYDTLLSLMIRD